MNKGWTRECTKTFCVCIYYEDLTKTAKSFIIISLHFLLLFRKLFAFPTKSLSNHRYFIKTRTLDSSLHLFTHFIKLREVITKLFAWFWNFSDTTYFPTKLSSALCIWNAYVLGKKWNFQPFSLKGKRWWIFLVIAFRQWRSQHKNLGGKKFE